MSDLSFEIIAKTFRENFHPQEVTIAIAQRSDIRDGYRITLTENETRRQKEFLTGPRTTVNDLQDMVITAAKLFRYTWDNTPYEGEAV